MSTDEKHSMFTPAPVERNGVPVVAWGVAGLVVLVLVGILMLAGRHKGAAVSGAVLPLDPYAGSLAISDVQMSESTSLSGGKSTFIDGQIRNSGTRTVTGATVQVLFQNDVQMPPQVETEPVNLIRTHEPYVDTQTLSATPLKPGDQREFRLVFETIGTNWNQQIPEIHVTEVSAK